jgi:predicted peptidase
MSPKRTPTSTQPPTTVPPTATARPTTRPTTVPSPTSKAIHVGQHPYSMTVEVQETQRITQTVVVNYLLYLPQGYRKDAQQKWPLILFLHGQLEWGDDPTILTRQGVPKLLDEGEELPAIVVSPQTPEGKRWWPRTAILGAFLDRIEAIYAVDLQRVYLTGISMGGYGAWALAMRYPQRFAALVPIAGGADFNTDEVPPEICGLKDVPTWAFHGEMDVNVPYTESVNAVDALRACGGNVRLTLYPDAAHVASWERAYADEELWKWLFAQKRQ